MHLEVTFRTFTLNMICLWKFQSVWSESKNNVISSHLLKVLLGFCDIMNAIKNAVFALDHDFLIVAQIAIFRNFRCFYRYSLHNVCPRDYFNKYRYFETILADLNWCIYISCVLENVIPTHFSVNRTYYRRPLFIYLSPIFSASLFLIDFTYS